MLRGGAIQGKLIVEERKFLGMLRVEVLALFIFNAFRGEVTISTNFNVLDKFFLIKDCSNWVLIPKKCIVNFSRNMSGMKRNLLTYTLRRRKISNAALK